MDNKYVGTLLRAIYIDADIRNSVNDILRAPSPESKEVEIARARLMVLGLERGPYACATQVRAYLEEKTQIGREPWAFPIAGDLFLDGLELQVAGLGPNLFKDYYSGAYSCYLAGNDPARTAQAPFYAVDLLLKRTLVLFLERKSIQSASPGASLSFVSQEPQGYAELLDEFFRIMRGLLTDGVAFLTSPKAAAVHKEIVSSLADLNESMKAVLKQWPVVLGALKDSKDGEEEQLLHLLEAARKLGHRPLELFVREELARFYGPVKSSEASETDPRVVHAYETAVAWTELGNVERQASAYLLAVHRYERAVALFKSIQDRTSVAKALVEEARAYLTQGGERPMVQKKLRDAFRYVMAHKLNLKGNALPNVKDSTIYEFLHTKGYELEAAAFRESLELITLQ